MLCFYYDIIVFMTYSNIDWLNSLPECCGNAPASMAWG